MRFTKMHGLGNDYIYIDCTHSEPPDLPALAVHLSERHFGVGADGIICIKEGKTGDFTMEMYNADGSRGMMCGNGIRCVGKYVYDNKLTRKTCLRIDTDAGARELELHVRYGLTESVSVDMGEASVLEMVTLESMGVYYQATPVLTGNPHAVIFCPDPWAVNLQQVGPLLEQHPALPWRSNIEFVSADTQNQMTLRVWERGSGITLACGTGACAAFAAARKRKLCANSVTVRLSGGELSMKMQGENIIMTGPCVTVFEGEIDENALARS